MKTERLISIMLFLTNCLIFSPAWAGWSAISLQPSGNYAGSEASSVSEGQIGGTGIVITSQGDQVPHPAYWSNATPSGYKDLFSSVSGQVLAVGGGAQAGYLDMWAMWWKGTTQHYPVNSINSISSFIYGLDSGWAVGSLQPQWDGPQKATIWKLTDTYSEAPVSLAPAGSTDSRLFAITGASATDPGKQAGMVDGNAAYWSGTAASYVNLHPAGAESSIARAASGDFQAGWVETHPDVYRAARWSGTAQSLLDLQPEISGITDSQIFGMADGVEVGRIYFGSNAILDSRAFLWWDSKDDYVNLQELLPQEYTASRAEAVDWFDGKLWVAGTAWNGTLGREEAMLWTYYSVPEPSTFLLLGAGVGSLLFWRRRS